jgi:hypothetical protein
MTANHVSAFKALAGKHLTFAIHGESSGIERGAGKSAGRQIEAHGTGRRYGGANGQHYRSRNRANPDFGANLAVDYLLGMAKIKRCVKTFLDINLMLAG